MSAFCAIFFRQGGSPSAELFEPLQPQLEALGPDAKGSFESDGYAIRYAHYATTPEAEQELMPLTDDSSGLVLAGNLRLDNRERLIGQLALRDNGEALLTDGKLALEAYRRWGKDAFARLYGDFSLVIWDSRAQEVICARDCFGVRQLYFSLTEEVLAVSSDLRLLRDLPLLDTPRTGVLMRGSYKWTHTPFRGIQKLPQAHWLAVDPSRDETRRYWEPVRNPSRCGTLEEWQEHLEALTVTAVERRLRTSRKVGVHLSGGLDSSLVAALAQRTLRQKGETLHAFSACPSPAGQVLKGDDERILIEKVARDNNIPCHYCSIGPENLETLRSLAVTTLVEFDEFAIHARARELGVGVLLSGIGGDEGLTYNGRGALLELLRNGELRAAWSSLKIRKDPIGSFRREVMLRRQRLQRSKYHLENCSQQRYIQFMQCWFSFRTECWDHQFPGQPIEYRHPLLDRELVEAVLRVPLAWVAGELVWSRFVRALLPDDYPSRRLKRDLARSANLDFNRDQLWLKGIVSASGRN
ncbi:asparagine synthetase B [bacterium]|nr:asparagine synthetase B [bacterium]